MAAEIRRRITRLLTAESPGPDDAEPLHRQRSGRGPSLSERQKCDSPTPKGKKNTLDARFDPGLTRPPTASLDKLSPTASTLRANPYPEVTDPICRFPLPTFIHRLEAVHLGDLMRISVRAGANVQQRNPPTGFSRASRERPRTSQKRDALRDSL